MNAEIIRVTVNGEAREVPRGTSGPQLLTLLGIDPRLVALALNGVVVRRVDLASTVLSDGDEIEIVRAVGGG